MAVSVTVRDGDIFDGPSDLLVVPCSSQGTVTGFVARRLENYAIPKPPKRMRLGAVKVVRLKSAQHVAQFVAFAASVDGISSNIDAIGQIGANLGEFTVREESVQLVSAPLLGAGAGKLRRRDVIEALSAGFRRTARDGARLKISVLGKSKMSLARSSSAREEERPEALRVFISHTSISAAQVRWVTQLALFLKRNGIQARLDRLHLLPGMDLPQWMTNELVLADKVVVVCDARYKEKADGSLGGVGWETMIIQGDMASLPPDSTKYQVMVREDELARGLPIYLRTKFAIHAKPSSDSKRARAALLRGLQHRPDGGLADRWLGSKTSL